MRQAKANTPIDPTHEERTRVDEADIQDDIDRTTAIGIENAEILTLAANWCENIGVTRGPMGVGLVEQVTGLPVGGGSLRCSHAHTPTSFGMQLKFSAADFYQENCIGCTYHKPRGGQIPRFATGVALVSWLAPSPTRVPRIS